MTRRAQRKPAKKPGKKPGKKSDTTPAIDRDMEALARKTGEAIAGIRVTHPDRLLFAQQDVNKRELIDYYLLTAGWILPHVAMRPLSLLRCPKGAGEECFFQKHASKGFPDAFETIRIKEKSGAGDYLFIRDERGLVAAVQMGVLELHIWGCRVDAIEKPDRLVFDFDPDEGLPFAQVRAGALEMRDRLATLGLKSFALATGGKGIHVIAPLARGHTWDAHHDFARRLAHAMAADSPQRYVTTMAKDKRQGKIFIDCLRNTRGATAIAPYSTRARANAAIALPLTWAQAAKLDLAHPATVTDASRLIGRTDPGREPWPGYFKVEQTLPRAA